MAIIRISLLLILSVTIILPTASISPALHLTPIIHLNRTAEARTAALVNSSLFLNVTSYSGFLTVDHRYDSNTFFWYFPAEKKPANETPWIIWLQGGPGATSLAGLFDEMGPFRYDNGILKLRKTSWWPEHSMLFIDNPIGAGFSYTNSPDGFPRDMNTYSNHLYSTLQQFLTIFPELRTAPLYIAGESYAGRYVPALGEKVLDGHKVAGNPPINLQGLILGNPVLNREDMMDYTSLYYQWGLLDPQGVQAMKPLQDKYINAVRSGKNIAAFDLYNEIWAKLQEMVLEVNSYNILVDNYDFKGFMKFIEREDVREALHVGKLTFTFSNHTLHFKLVSDFLVNVRPKVEKLLENYRVLIYCGQLDETAPCVSNAEGRRKNWQWSGREEFLKAPRQPWVFNDNVAGYVKSGGRFTEVLVRGAGHLVPIDKPGEAQALISHFIQGIDLPVPTNFKPNYEDTPPYEEQTPRTEPHGNRIGLIVSAIINVVLVLVIIGLVFMYVRWRRNNQAAFYASVDTISDEIFLS